MLELVKEDNNGKLITELKTVCKYFNKSHRHCLRDIGVILKDLPSVEGEFIPIIDKDKCGRNQNTYYLTEKGFYLLTSSFKGTKARQFQSKFFDAFQELKKENEMLIDACTQLLHDTDVTKSGHTSTNGLESGEITKSKMSADEIIKAFQELKKENKMLLDNYYLKSNTYCISDIVQKFKNLKPVTAQGILFSEDVLEFRQNGIFPTEYYESNDTIVSVLDYKRGRYYPRYTLKGVLLVEEKLIEKGYKYKGID